jgi:myo-inositol 2-dehydrogenase/D-chiro-inositol 1-dehydrogenase
VIVHCAHRNPSVHAFFDSAMIITDTVVHEVDITRWLLGQEIVRVQVMTPRPSSRAREGLRDPQLVIFETERGQLVTVEAFVERRATATTSSVRSWARRARPRCRLAVSQNFQQRFETAYQHELERWVAGEPGANAWDGYAAAAVCEAAVESLETGAPVDVSLDRRGATSAAR